MVSIPWSSIRNCRTSASRSDDWPHLNPRTQEHTLGTARKPRPKWYRTPIKRAELKRLAQTDNRTGLLYLLGFSALLGTSGLLAALSIGSGWALPAFMFYGGVWIFATSIAHETCHGTAFRTRLLNEIVLYLAGMMVQQTPTGLRWTHLRHHNQTSIVGKDVEIVLTNPMDWTGFLSRQLADLNSIGYYARSVVQLAIGRPDQDHRACLSKRALTRVTWEARSPQFPAGLLLHRPVGPGDLELVADSDVLSPQNRRCTGPWDHTGDPAHRPRPGRPRLQGNHPHYVH